MEVPGFRNNVEGTKNDPSSSVDADATWSKTLLTHAGRGKREEAGRNMKETRRNEIFRSSWDWQAATNMYAARHAFTSPGQR